MSNFYELWTEAQKVKAKQVTQDPLDFAFIQVLTPEQREDLERNPRPRDLKQKLLKMIRSNADEGIVNAYIAQEVIEWLQKTRITANVLTRIQNTLRNVRRTNAVSTGWATPEREDEGLARRLDQARRNWSHNSDPGKYHPYDDKNLSGDEEIKPKHPIEKATAKPVGNFLQRLLWISEWEESTNMTFMERVLQALAVIKTKGRMSNEDLAKLYVSVKEWADPTHQHSKRSGSPTDSRWRNWQTWKNTDPNKPIDETDAMMKDAVNRVNNYFNCKEYLAANTYGDSQAVCGLTLKEFKDLAKLCPIEYSRGVGKITPELIKGLGAL